MGNDTDMELECLECRSIFIWTSGEQEFYADKGMQQPKRCKDCRKKRKLTKDAGGSGHDPNSRFTR